MAQAAQRRKTKPGAEPGRQALAPRRALEHVGRDLHHHCRPRRGRWAGGRHWRCRRICHRCWRRHHPRDGRRCAGGCRNRLEHRLQPFEDGFPLVQVRLHLGRRHVEKRQPLLHAAHVALRLADHADEGQADAVGPLAKHVVGARSRIEPHADGGHLAATAGHARQRLEFGVAVGRGVAVEHRMAHRKEDRVGGHHHLGEVQAAQPAGCVEHHMGDAGRRPQDVARVGGPADDGLAAHGLLARSAPEPGLRRALEIDVAKHRGMAAIGEPGGEMRGQRGLAAATLAIDDGNDGHGRRVLGAMRQDGGVYRIRSSPAVKALAREPPDSQYFFALRAQSSSSSSSSSSSLLTLTFCATSTPSISLPSTSTRWPASVATVTFLK